MHGKPGDNRAVKPDFPISAAPPGAIVLSVVSHGHGAMVLHLLQELAACGAGGPGGVARVVLTQNLPEPAPAAPAGGWPFVLELRRNARPQGFSANHNAALAWASEPYLCVLNPDVHLQDGNPFPALLRALAHSGAGLAYPRQVDADGAVQDSEREVPTPWSLLRRYLAGRSESRAEWVNAAFWLVRREAWLQVGGLDAGYFMYCEDVDFCLRLRLAGWRLARAAARVRHAGQRDSHRRLRHGLWHIRALLRLWRTPTFWRARPMLQRMTAAELILCDS